MIDIQNLTASDIDEDFARKAIKKTLASEGINAKIHIDIAFVGEERIKKLNKKYRHKNKATDVLSFGGGRDHFLSSKSKEKYLGEIVVCPAVVKKNSKRCSTPFARELAHVIIHGMLHLLGYEHEGSEEKTSRMHSREEEIMKSLNFKSALWPAK